jgi:pimeloyl-ACP methyl ester carboxylesterase
MTDAAGMHGAENLRLAVNGVELHAVAAGPRDGRLVILLHGFPEFWFGWHRQIGPLAAAGLRVVAPDQRGYNLSTKPEGVAPYAFETLAADVLALATALGRERFTLVGHDWGAILAWHLAAQHPERVEAAAILNGPNLATLWPHMRRHPTQALRVFYFGVFQLPWLPEAGLRAAGFASLVGGMRATALPGTFTEAHFARYRAAWSQPGALTAMLNWYRALARHGPKFVPGRIRPPIRVIWGDRDVALDRRLVGAGLSLCDRGEAFHLPEATHWVQHDRPEEVNRLLLEFLQP